jgi:hypothetical protein
MIFSKDTSYKFFQYHFPSDGLVKMIKHNSFHFKMRPGSVSEQEGEAPNTKSILTMR